jgi:hypothetical protein
MKPFSAAYRLIIWLCLVKVTLWRSFQQSAIFSVTLMYIDFLQSVNSGRSISKTWRRKIILQGKGDSGLLYSGIDKIPVSHLTETEK